MKSKILSLNYPIITSFPTEANLLSIFFREEERAWFLNHFIMLSNISNYLDYDIARNPLLLLKNCPLIHAHGLSKTYINKTFKTFNDFVISAIDDNYYIYLYVARADIHVYKGNINDHDLMIYGYDKEQKCFSIADFFVSRYSFETCSFEELENAYHNAVADFTNGVVLIKRSNTYQNKIDIPTAKILLHNYLHSQNTLKLVDRSFNLQSDSDYTYGINIYEGLLKSVDNNTNEGIWSVKNIHILYDHKKLLKELAIRIYLEGHLMNPEPLWDKLDILINNCLLLRNLILKYAINNIRNKEVVQEKLVNIRDLEIDVLSLFLNQICEDEIQLNNQYHKSINLFCRVVFLKTVSDLGGNWKNIYGKVGYYIVGEKPSYPERIKMKVYNANFYLRDIEDIDRCALLLPNTTSERIAANLYSYDLFTIEFLLEQPQKITFYFYDFEREGRHIQIEILDVQKNKLLLTYDLTNFKEGVYVSFLLEGYVKLHFKTVNSYDAVISGVFFD